MEVDVNRNTKKEYTTPVTSSTILAIEPEVRATPYGWLATSPREAPLHIGVHHATEVSAQRAFQGALAAWAALRDMPDPMGDQT
jgi:hypothetical protein